MSMKRLFIALLSIALLNCSILRTAATDSNNNESGTETNAPSENGLMYAGGG